jgi:hypothetical protein
MVSKLQSEDTDKVFAFINLAHPSQLKDQTKQTIIHTHVGRYYRNRSKPSQRKYDSIAPAARNHYGPIESSNHGSNDQSGGYRAVKCGGPGPLQRNGRLHYAEEFLETLVKETQQLQKPVADRHEKHRLEEGREGYTGAEAPHSQERGKHINFLGQSRRDPFGQYPIDRFGHLIPALVDHGMYPMPFSKHLLTLTM